MIMSSRYTNTVLKLKSLRQLSIRCWKVIEALLRPKGIQLNLKRLRGVIKMVLVSYNPEKRRNWFAQEP